MKKIFTLFLVSSIFFASKAQDIVSTDKIWSNIIYYYPTTIATEYFKVTDESIIDSYTYYKVMRSTYKRMQYWSSFGFIREESGKVYYRKSETDPELLIYDFTAEEGDTLTVFNIYNEGTNAYYNEVEYIVTSIDSLLVGEEYKKQIHLESIVEGTAFTETEQWVESMGSLSGFLHNYNGFVDTDAYFLLCFEVSSETVYMNPSYSSCYYYFTNDIVDYSSELTVSLYPNPVSDIAYIKITGPSTGATRTIEVFDYRGALILSDSMVDEFELSRSEFSSGLYLYRILENGAPVYQGKFIVR